MKKIKVSEASEVVLDWLVTKCEGRSEPDVVNNFAVAWYTWPNTHYSTNWSQGGPIIDREIGNLWKHNKLDPNEPDVWTAAAYCKAPDGTMLYYEDGSTPLIAAMRCYVSSKLGDEVEVPEELCK